MTADALLMKCIHQPHGVFVSIYRVAIRTVILPGVHVPDVLAINIIMMTIRAFKELIVQQMVELDSGTLTWFKRLALDKKTIFLCNKRTGKQDDHCKATDK